MPGYGHGDWDETYNALSEQGEGQDHSPRIIETPVYSRVPIVQGIWDAMEYGGFNNGGAPTVPMPVRSSLAQLILRWRTQFSLYISFVRRGTPEQLDAMGIGHIFVRAQDTPYQAPVVTDRIYPKPVIRRYGTIGHTARAGRMGISPRFNKACE